MSRYVKNGEVKSIYELRQMYPNSLIPDNGDMSWDDWLLLQPTPAPAPLPGHHVEEGAPDGDQQTWVQVPYTNEELLAQAKARRAEEVAAITVTTQAGNTFDGHEDAQNRMSRAALAMSDTDVLPWVLADNSIAQVSRAELQEALRLAGLATAELWIKPYLPE